MTLIALTFLTPLAGLVAGVIALPALLLLYFLKLRRRTVRVSTVLLWSQAVQDLQVNTPFRMIRPSLLLLLHLLVLACFLGAVARPAIDAPAGGGSSVILVIDRSASMSAMDGDEEAADRHSRLDIAKARAEELVGRLLGLGGGRSRIMLVTFADQAQTVVNYTRDAGLLRDAIRGIEPTDQPARLEAALKVVEAFAVQVDEDAAPDPPRVMLLSDGGFERSAGAAAPGLDRVGFEFLRIGPEPDGARDNAGIVALSARRDFDDPATVRVFVRLVSTVREQVTTALRCELNGEVASAEAVTIPAATVDAPGEITHSFAVQSAEGGVLRVVLPRGDALAADNAAALVLLPLRGLRITLVRPGEAQQAAEVQLARALESLEPQSLRVVTEAELPRSGSDRWQFAGADLVVLDRVRPEVLPPMPTLSFGATLPMPGLGIGLDAPHQPGGFTYWLRTHPVMRYVALGGVTLDRPMPLSVPESAEGDATSVRYTSLASGSSGPLIVLAEQGLIRRLVVGVDLAETNWWRDPSFPVFIANAADYLTLRGEQASGIAVTTTQPVAWPMTGTGTEAALVGPGGFRRTVLRAGDGTASFGTLPRVGLYRVEPSPPDDRGVIAVNLLDENESRIRTSETVLIGGEVVTSSRLGRLAPKEIWHWFVLAGLALLTVEWALFAWRMRV